MVRSIRRLLTAPRRFARDRSGIAAVEFAMILPILLVMYLGAIELGDAMTIKRKVTRVTSTLNDLITQTETITDADMTNILDAAASIITPYATTTLSIRVTAVETDHNGVGRVQWSDARNTNAYTKNQVVSLPSSLSTANNYLVMSEVSYAYTPIIGRFIASTLDLEDRFYLKPRTSAEIDRTTN